MSNPSSRHLPSLDGFRGVAIVLVMISHFIGAGGTIDKSNAIFRLLHGGFVGVDMFFVLSGFLITGILLDAPKDCPNYFRVFYLRRAVRIFPLYYAVLIGVFLTCQAGPDSPWWYWLFASNLGATAKGNWLTSPEGVNLSHLWSLAVEEQFYLLWPFLVRFLSRKTLERICLACLILAPAVHYALHFSGNPVGAYLFTPTRFNTLAAGAWLALVLRDPARWQRWLKLAPRAIAIAGPITVVGLMFPDQISLVPFSPFLWGAILMLAMEPTSFLSRRLSTPLWITFGKFSYALYLFHYLFDPWLKERVYGVWITGFAGEFPVLSLILFLMTASALSFAAALVSWFVLERPFLSLKRFFRYQTRQPSPENYPA